MESVGTEPLEDTAVQDSNEESEMNERGAWSGCSEGRLVPYVPVVAEQTDDLDCGGQRGEDGFGSTGLR